LANLKDIKFLIALDYLQQAHPNTINYQLIEASYQVVTGVYFLVKFTGYDEITKISTKLYVGLNGVPSVV
jgi:hypothetical protein